ncbi:MAG TPA: hypothetical protein VF765_21435 [Polyangiaceae bacterium]
MSLEIRPVGPFDLSLTLAFLSGFGPTRGEQDVGVNEVTKAFIVGGRAVAVRARGLGEPDGPRLSIQVFADRALDQTEAKEARSRIEDLLTTSQDLAPFYAQAAEDTAYAPLVPRFCGLHHVRFASAFEAACWGVINQRIGLTVARRMKDALVRRAGSSITVDGVEHWAFPEPRSVLEVGERELGRLVPGGHRAAALMALARAFSEASASFLNQAPIADVRAWLRAIHGVGPFTSSFVLYRGLGRFDGVAVVSPTLVAAAERQYGRSLGSGGVARVAERYGEWGGLWMLYLWASTFVPPKAS